MTQRAPETPSVSRAADDAPVVPFPKPRQLFALLAVYFAIQVVSRLCFSSSVDLDESEAVVLAQKFSLGYGQQPPLPRHLRVSPNTLAHRRCPCGRENCGSSMTGRPRLPLGPRCARLDMRRNLML